MLGPLPLSWMLEHPEEGTLVAVGLSSSGLCRAHEAWERESCSSPTHGNSTSGDNLGVGEHVLYPSPMASEQEHLMSWPPSWCPERSVEPRRGGTGRLLSTSTVQGADKGQGDKGKEHCLQYPGGLGAWSCCSPWKIICHFPVPAVSVPAWKVTPDLYYLSYSINTMH